MADGVVVEGVDGAVRGTGVLSPEPGYRLLLRDLVVPEFEFRD